MGLSVIIFPVLVLFLSMFVFGVILLVRKRRKLGTAMLSLPVLIVLFFIGGFLYLSHNTNPKSLNFSIEQEASPDYHYNLSGKWNERIDYYSFGTDFVAICTKDNKKVKMT
ncbi:MAG TPA: hypothetical protein VK190_12170, partial [Pseudoneobacillus sp.]|nr:hypothetical protein [Pseudoneobacillus sp.]